MGKKKSQAKALILSIPKHKNILKIIQNEELNACNDCSESSYERQQSRKLFHELNQLEEKARINLINTLKNKLDEISSPIKIKSIHKIDIQNINLLASAIIHQDKKYKIQASKLIKECDLEGAWVYLGLALELLENEDYYEKLGSSRSLLIAALNGQFTPDDTHKNSVNLLFSADPNAITSSRLTVQGVNWCKFIISHPKAPPKAKSKHYFELLQHLCTDFKYQNKSSETLMLIKKYRDEVMHSDKIKDKGFCVIFSLFTAETPQELLEDLHCFITAMAEEDLLAEMSKYLFLTLEPQSYYKPWEFQWSKDQSIQFLKKITTFLSVFGNRKEYSWLKRLIPDLINNVDYSQCLELEEANILKQYLVSINKPTLTLQCDLMREVSVTTSEYLNLIITLLVAIEKNQDITPQLFNAFQSRFALFEERFKQDKVLALELDKNKERINYFLHAIQDKYLIQKINGKNPEECFILAKNFQKIGKTQDAYPLFLHAATLKYLPAMFEVSSALFEGNGIKKDLQKALEWSNKLQYHANYQSKKQAAYNELLQQIKMTLKAINCSETHLNSNIGHILDEDPETHPRYNLDNNNSNPISKKKEKQQKKIIFQNAIPMKEKVYISPDKSNSFKLFKARPESQSLIEKSYPKVNVKKNSPFNSPSPLSLKDHPQKTNNAIPKEEDDRSLAVKQLVNKSELEKNSLLNISHYKIQTKTTWVDIVKGEDNYVANIVEAQRTGKDSLDDATVKCIEHFLKFLNQIPRYDESYLLVTFNLLTHLTKDYYIKNIEKLRPLYKSTLKFCALSGQYTALHELYCSAAHHKIMNAELYQLFIEGMLLQNLHQQAAKYYSEAEKTDSITPETKKSFQQIMHFLPSKELSDAETAQTDEKIINKLDALIDKKTTKPNMLAMMELIEQLSPEYCQQNKNKVRQIYCNAMTQCSSSFQYILLDKLVKQAFYLNLADSELVEKAIESALVYKLSSQALSYFEMTKKQGIFSPKIQHLYIRSLYWSNHRDKAYFEFESLTHPLIVEGRVDLSDFNTTTICMFMEKYKELILNLDHPLKIDMMPRSIGKWVDTIAESKVIQANLIAYAQNFNNYFSSNMLIPEVIIPNIMMKPEEQKQYNTLIKEYYWTSKESAFAQFMQLALPKIQENKVDLSGFNSTTIIMYLEVHSTEITKRPEPLKILFTPIHAEQVIELCNESELIIEWVEHYNRSHQPIMPIPEIIIQEKVVNAEQAPSQDERNQFFAPT